MQQHLNRRSAESAGSLSHLQLSHSKYGGDESSVQRMSAYSAIANGPAPIQRQAAPQGGLPANLKSGIEGLSGIAMDDVRVHYNSSKPAQLQAHAYAQGTDIHIAPGQERHLPHEAWHVVQQKQGRVKPTLQLKGVAINDDSALEREADVMGGRATTAGDALRTVPLQRKAAEGMPKQLKGDGRKSKISEDKTVLKLVLPGSAYKHWATRTDEEHAKMLPLFDEEAKDPQLAWQHPDLDKWEVTIAGPQAYGGVSDTGANSIEENYKLGVALLNDKIQALMTDDENPVPLSSIVVLIKGHSRNAVAATRIANTIAKVFSPEGLVVELVAFDPVPGPGHKDDDVDITLDPSIVSTAVYSFKTEYIAGFAPQFVRGTKRMIISLEGHSAGLAKGFIKSGKPYKGSNLNSLPQGLYASSGAQDAMGREIIYQITTEVQLEEFIAKNSSMVSSQWFRENVITELAAAFKLTKKSGPEMKGVRKEKPD